MKNDRRNKKTDRKKHVAKMGKAEHVKMPHYT